MIGKPKFSAYQNGNFQFFIRSRTPLKDTVQAIVFTLVLFLPEQAVNAAPHSVRSFQLNEFPSPSGVILSPALITRISNQNLYLVHYHLFGIREKIEHAGYSRRVGGSVFLGLSVVETGSWLEKNAPTFTNNSYYFTVAYTRELPFSYLNSMDAGLSYVYQQINEFDINRYSNQSADFGINFTFIDNENTELIAGAGFMQSRWYYFGVADPQFFDVFAHFAFFKRRFFISASAGFNDDAVSPAVANTGSIVSDAFRLARLGGFLNALVLGYDYGDLAGGRVILRDDDSGWLGAAVNPLGFWYPEGRHHVVLSIDYGPDFLAGDNSGRGPCFIFRLDYHHKKKKP
jgi:hypothetical protein